MTKDIQNSIIIVGGGMNGLTLSLLLAQENFNVTCIDATPKAVQTDERTTAISYGSSQILHSAGVWEETEPHACPIQDIKILDGKSPSLLSFDVKNFDKTKNYSAFGWIVENTFLFNVLNQHCAKEKNITHVKHRRVSKIEYQKDQATVTLEDDTKYETALIIGADGRQSFTRKINNIPTKKWSYNQKAVICTAAHQNPHHNIAIEHFRSDGPFAILPMMDKPDGTHQSAVVWTLHKNDSMNIIDNPDIFLTALNERFPTSYGDVLHASTPQVYPLNFNHAYEYISHRTALIGDAAHGIHPIAGQGLNIGLQDVGALHKILGELKVDKKDIGDKDNLKIYEQMRKPDNTAMAAATDLLNRLFSNNVTPIKLLRQKGLKIIERAAPSKKFFIRRAMGIKD